MTTLEFLSHLRTKDVKVWIDDNKLRFRAPERAMTPDLKAEMAARKGEILRFLRDLKDTSRAEMPPLRRATRRRSATSGNAATAPRVYSYVPPVPCLAGQDRIACAGQNNVGAKGSCGPIVNAATIWTRRRTAVPKIRRIAAPNVR